MNISSVNFMNTLPLKFAGVYKQKPNNIPEKDLGFFNWKKQDYWVTNDRFGNDKKDLADARTKLPNLSANTAGNILANMKQLKREESSAYETLLTTLANKAR